jgi:hypothetical protein
MFDHRFSDGYRAFSKIRGWTSPLIPLSVALVSFVGNSWSTDIFYIPTPALDLPESNPTIAILSLLNEMGLSPQITTNEQLVPEKAWCLALSIAIPKEGGSDVRSYIIKLFVKGGNTNIALDIHQRGNEIAEKDLKNVTKCLLTTFVIK